MPAPSAASSTLIPPPAVISCPSMINLASSTRASSLGILLLQLDQLPLCVFDLQVAPQTAPCLLDGHFFGECLIHLGKGASSLLQREARHHRPLGGLQFLFRQGHGK